MFSERESEDFEAWLTDMPDCLRKFLDEIEVDGSIKLDFSANSLLSIESLLLSRFPDQMSYKQFAETHFVDGVTRYVGEVFRRSLGGRWELSRKNPNDVNFGLPVLTGYIGETTPTCPHRLVLVSVARRRGDFLYSVLTNITEDQKKLTEKNQK